MMISNVFFGFLMLSMRTTVEMSAIEGILKESLRSNRVQACDGERITLSCPRNTHIIVQNGFYGRVVPESQLCPAPLPRPGTLTTTQKSKYFGSTTCDVIQAHTKIREICDKRRKCTMVVDTHTFEDDPCPSTSKYLQMTYACMPVAFEDETICESTEMRLECREGRRLAVFSAIMKSSPQCAENRTQNECTSDVLPQLLQHCHAQEGCSIKTDMFKSGCKESNDLQVVYVCVNEEIFSEEAIKGEIVALEVFLKESENSKLATSNVEQRIWHGEPEIEMPVQDVHQINNDASYVTHDEYGLYKPAENPLPEVERVEPNLVGLTSEFMVFVNFLQSNEQKTIACIVLSICITLIVILTLCVIRKTICPGSERIDSIPNKQSLETRLLVSSRYGDHIMPEVNIYDFDDDPILRSTTASTFRHL